MLHPLQDASDKRSHPPTTAGRRFSDASVWAQQREYFETAGSLAWRQNIVPSHATSNAWIAQAYARAVMGYLRDARSQGEVGMLTIIDVGAGSGQFAFHCLKALQGLHADAALRHDAPYRYICTDFTRRNIEFCAAHPAMQDFIDRGVLDVALLDVTRDAPVRLLKSGETLQPGSVPGPVVLIANYLFDSIPQDVFYLDAGRLHECLSRPVPGAEEDPGYAYNPVSTQYYPEPNFNELLDMYCGMGDLRQTHFPFPVAGLRFLDRMLEMAGKGLFILTADKGFSAPQQLRNRGLPHIARHGSQCVSLPVNYHLIAEYIKHKGGRSWLPHRPHQSLCVAGFLLNMQSCTETECAFNDAINHYGPDDFFTLKKSLERNFSNMSVPEILAYMRFSAYDSTAFQRACQALCDQSCALGPAVIDEIKGIGRQVRDNHYDLGRFDLDATIRQVLECAAG